MTKEQLIQEYSDCIYPKIAKALISETKVMLIERAWKFFSETNPINWDLCNENDIIEYKEQFKKAMEE